MPTQQPLLYTQLVANIALRRSPNVGPSDESVRQQQQAVTSSQAASNEACAAASAASAALEATPAPGAFDFSTAAAIPTLTQAPSLHASGSGTSARAALGVHRGTDLGHTGCASRLEDEEVLLEDMDFTELCLMLDAEEESDEEESKAVAATASAADPDPDATAAAAADAASAPDMAAAAAVAADTAASATAAAAETAADAAAVAGPVTGADEAVEHSKASGSGSRRSQSPRIPSARRAAAAVAAAGALFKAEQPDAASDAAPEVASCTVEELAARMTRVADAWSERARALLSKGGAKQTEVDALLSDSEQFMWGSAELDPLRWVTRLALRLRERIWLCCCENASGVAVATINLALLL